MRLIVLNVTGRLPANCAALARPTSVNPPPALPSLIHSSARLASVATEAGGVKVSDSATLSTFSFVGLTRISRPSPQSPKATLKKSISPSSHLTIMSSTNSSSPSKSSSNSTPSRVRSGSMITSFSKSSPPVKSNPR